MKRAFREEVRRSTWVTGVTGAVLTVFTFPAWSVFDYLVEPGHAEQFVALRLGATALIAAGIGLLLTAPGRRRPEPIMVALMLVIELAIALMVVRIDSQHAAYALGMSVPVYAAAFLLVWSWHYSAVIVVGSWAGLVAAALTAPDPLSARAMATIGFYLGNASLLSLIAQVHRERLAWREFRIRAHNHELLEEMARLSSEDPLTGLANRRSWDLALEHAVDQAVAHGDHLAIMIWDIDHFKHVNDELGHAVGDAVLRSAAAVLRENARSDDVVARLGGDEFALLCPGCDAKTGYALAERIRDAFARATSLDPELPLVTCSIGVAAASGQQVKTSGLMLQADQHLYVAKQRRDSVSAGTRDHLVVLRESRG